MRILSVDTSSERGSVCIMTGGEVAGEVRLAGSVQHSERLFRSVDFLLEHAGFELGGIDLFVAVRGPGSFTGLRLGMAAIEGFASAHGRPAAGVSTLEALAWKSGVRGLPIVAVIDARRGEVYGAMYQRVGDDLDELRAPAVMKPEEWFASLPKEPLALCGDGAMRYRDWISHPAWDLLTPDLYLAAAAARIAARNPGPLSPLYVRRAEAEIVRERRSESVASPHPKS